jgi:hypothetical protein
MSIRTSVVDLPRQKGEEDLFSIDKYKNGLIQFVKNAETPITIALQGEWGSGKTSLMNSLQDELCGDLNYGEQETDSKDFYGVWINTWQYSLMSSREETLFSIIMSISSKIEEVYKNRHIGNATKLKDSLVGIFKKLSVATAKIAAEKIIDGGSEGVDAFINEKSELTISHLRNELQTIINQCVKPDKNNISHKGFIFFIDDLDRIDPPVAVEILELLKNIFDLNHCVFILAIDYDVVIKGLKPKFGELTEKNEREFRSFFDKIIQMPFSMPVTSYVIDKFLEDKLISIDYFTKEELSKDNLLKSIIDISQYTVGSNPRSLKRLINSLSLIKCINASIDTDKDAANEILEKVINFALVSVQISYPTIYNLLVKFPEFNAWDEKVAIQLNLGSIDDEFKVKLSSQKEFDEEWEQILFRVCEKELYLSKNALNISRLFNLILKFCKENGENASEMIESVILLSSVTNLAANDKPVIDYHRGNLLKTLRWNVLQELRKQYPDNKNIFLEQGKRVQTNAYLKFTQNDWGRWFKLYTHPYRDKIRLIIITDLWWKKVNDNFDENLKLFNCYDEFYALESRMKSFMERYPSFFEFYTWKDYVHKDSLEFRFEFFNYLVFPTLESIHTSESVKMIAEVIVEMNSVMNELVDIQKKIGRAENHPLNEVVEL